MDKKYIDKILNKLEYNPENNCWEWIGCLNSKGYGQISVNNKDLLVHRIIYEYIHGPTTKEKPFVLHQCDNRRCCNPTHLYSGTHQNNQQDRVKRNPKSWAKGEKQHLSKLTIEQVLEIRESDERLVVLGKRFNVHPGTISDVRKRKSWAWLK